MDPQAALSEWLVIVLCLRQMGIDAPGKATPCWHLLNGWRHCSLPLSSKLINVDGKFALMTSDNDLEEQTSALLKRPLLS